jgi:outer membrane protein assembly factor BamB
MAMKRTDTWALPHRHFCFVQDGTLVAFGWPKKGDSTSVIHHIANRKVRTDTGPLVPSSKSIVLLPGSKAEELYVVSHDETIYRLTTAKVEEQLRHPYPNGDTRDQWFSRGDGRLVGGRAGALYLVAPNKPAIEYAIPERVLKHVAAGTGERVWYSYADVREDWNAHTIILAPTSTPMEAERTIDVAPMRIVHLASWGTTIAALLIVAGKMPSELAWKVAVFDESGKERWRADVPTGFSPGAALNNGFVAIGEHRVVVSTFDGALLAWDMTGKPVAPA